MVVCPKCKTSNPPELDTCENCQADLLPPPGPARRAWVNTRAALAGLLVIALGAAPFIFWKNDSGAAACKGLGALFGLFGLVVLISGLVRAIRPAPLHLRYLDRAIREAATDPQQAVTDFVHAVMLAPLKARATLTQKLPKKLKTVIATSEYALMNGPGGYQSPEGIRKIIYSGYVAWAHLAETIPQYGEATAIGWEAGAASAKADRKRKEIMNSLGKLFNELAADGLVSKLGWCPRCRAVVSCNEAGRCICEEKHGAAKGIVYVVPAEVDLFTKRLQQVYAG